jgi:His-Xaa-Ser repeat protein HxsA
MKKLRPLQWFIASIPLLTFRSQAGMPPPMPAPVPEPQDPVKLRALNLPGENLFAGHRSHSSHGSHRSSSGGGYSAPSPPPAPVQRVIPTPAPAPYHAPAPSPAAPQRFVPSGSNQPVDPGRPAAVTPQPSPDPTPPAMTLSEKRRLQIMRVQIALTSLGLYSGSISGELTNETKEAVKRIQIVKGLPDTGLMTTETLNALGVPAVQ